MNKKQNKINGLNKDIFYRYFWTLYLTLLQFAFLCANVKNIVPPDESIAILILQLSIYIFFSLFQGYVHVSIQAS